MIRELVTELQSLGLHVQGKLSLRKGGAGPAEGGTFLISGIPVSCDKKAIMPVFSVAQPSTRKSGLYDLIAL